MCTAADAVVCIVFKELAADFFTEDKKYPAASIRQGPFPSITHMVFGQVNSLYRKVF